MENQNPISHAIFSSPASGHSAPITHFYSQITCPADMLLMPAPPPGGTTTCPHCGAVYRLDEMCELTELEGPKRNPLAE